MKCMEYSKILLNLIFAALNLRFIRGQKVFPVIHADRVIRSDQLSDYLAVKVNFPEFGKYNVIG